MWHELSPGVVASWYVSLMALFILVTWEGSYKPLLWIIEILQTSSYKQYSVTLLSNKSMEGPMPGHRYTVKVVLLIRMT